MKLYVWKNCWFYNGTGMIMGIGENEEDALNEAVDYITSLNFAGLSRFTILKMVKEKTNGVVPEVHEAPLAITML